MRIGYGCEAYLQTIREEPLHRKLIDNYYLRKVEATMRTTIIVTCNASRAVLLPGELRFPASVKIVEICALGNEIIISPVGVTRDRFFF